jgi:ABC-type multidrug transport system ATPase subunit
VGRLAGITRVLVTHQLQYLPLVDRIYVMRDGTIETSGSYAQLIARGVDFQGLLHDDREQQVIDPAGALIASDTIDQEGSEAGDEIEAAVEDSEEEEENERRAKGQLIGDEERQTGAVDWRVYWQYLVGAGTAWFLPLMLLISLASEVRAPVQHARIMCDVRAV